MYPSLKASGALMLTKKDLTTPGVDQVRECLFACFTNHVLREAPVSSYEVALQCVDSWEHH